mmetsp:Transcript_7738/g.28537  ORF Transcript_7738/g.28537 Transcript_7738/m.28537 type:complete len:210 (-) Transcript_7738:161-790(-)
MDDPFAEPPAGEDPFAVPDGNPEPVSDMSYDAAPVGDAEVQSNGMNGHAFGMEPQDGMVAEEAEEEDGALDAGMFSAGGGNVTLQTGAYRAWEEENRKYLSDKSVREAELKTKVREEAEGEFTSFYDGYNTKKESRKQHNRENEEHTRSMIYAGLEAGGWASIVDVFCDVKKTGSKDTTRFKELMLRKKAKEMQEGSAPATTEETATAF